MIINPITQTSFSGKQKFFTMSSNEIKPNRTNYSSKESVEEDRSLGILIQKSKAEILKLQQQLATPKIPVFQKEIIKKKIIELENKQTECINTLITKHSKYASYNIKGIKCPNMSRGDLISSANFGLLTAAKKWDPEKFPDVKFTSYAAWWIQRQLRFDTLRYTSQIKTLETSYSLAPKRNKLIRIQNELRNKNLNPNLPIEELSQLTGLSKRTIKNIQKNGNTKLISLDKTFDYSDTDTYANKLESLKTPETEYIEKEKNILYKKIMKKIENLPEKLKYVVYNRFGISPAGTYFKPKTLSAIAQEMNYTTERIRQLEKIALEALRKNKDDLI